MRRLPGRGWILLLVSFALGTASGLTFGIVFSRPWRRTRSHARPPDPALFMQ